MPLGEASTDKLKDAHPDLQRFIERVAFGVDQGQCPGVRDITVLCTYRGKKEQDEAFKKGWSKLEWPKSKHNKKPTLAVDIAPFPVDWRAVGLPAFRQLRKYAVAVAAMMGIKIRIIDWDWPHYELASTS